MQEKSKLVIISKFAARSFRKSKFRNAVLILTLISSTAAILTINIMATNMIGGMKAAYRIQTGMDAHARIKNVSHAEIEKLRLHEQISESGTSVLVGKMIDNKAADVGIELRSMDKHFAKSMFAEPDKGREPAAKDEIVLGKSVLKRLGKSPKIGETIRIEWLNGLDSQRKSYEFVLVGYWEQNTEADRNYAWISEDMPEAAKAKAWDMSVTYKKSADIKHTTIGISEQLGLEAQQYEINSAYDAETLKNIQMEAIPLRLAAVLVFICTIIILYNVMQISIKLDIKLYGRMKALGATAHDIKCVIYIQVILVGAIGIPVGLVIGYMLGKRMVSQELAEYFLNKAIELRRLDFAVTAFITALASILAGIIPAGIAGKVSPTELLKEDNSFGFTRKNQRRAPGLPMLFHLSVVSMGRDKTRTVISIVFMTVGLTLLSCVYVVHNSFDKDKYKNELSISDYSVSDKVILDGQSAYDPVKMRLPADIADELTSIAGVTEKGELYSEEILINPPEKVIKNVTAYYEADNGEILDYMSYDVDWTAAYHNFLQDKECMATIFGMDGIVLESIVDGDHIMQGTLDREKFYSGNYAIAQGIYDPSIDFHQQPTYQVGDVLEADGNKFEIMAIVEAPLPITEGKSSRNAAFNLSFFIPASKFQDIYPDTGMRKLFFNVNEKGQKNVERYREGWDNGHVSMVSPATLAAKYKNETKAMTAVQILISCIIIAIGMLNLINSMITATTVRKKEFAIMQGLGMTKKQMRALLLFEGMNYAGITLILAYFVSIILINTVIKGHLKEQWSATFTFTINPLLICTPIIIGMVIIIPLLCLKQITKKNLHERL